MRNNKKILGAVLAVATVAGGGAALAKSAKMKVDPKLPPAVQPMHSLVGSWRGTFTMSPAGGQAFDAKIAIDCKGASQGYAILCTSRFTMPDGRVREATDLFGYDPGTNTYHWYSVSSAGDTHDHVAQPPAPSDNPVIQWVYSGRQDGQPMQEIVEFGFQKDCTEMTVKNSTVVGGQPVFSITGRLTKK